jgi:HPt (histidine-containing phosphotransfer) domain-containing protein
MRIEAIENLLIREERTLSLSTFSREKPLDQLNGDESLLVRMVALFQENTPHLLDDIRGAVARQSADDLARYGHASPSSCGMFGAVGAQRFKRGFEAAGERRDLREAKAAFLKLEDELDNVFTALERFTGEVSPLAILL